MSAWQPISTAPKDGRDVLCAWFYPDFPTLFHTQVLSYFADWYGEGKGSWVLEGDFGVRFLPDEIHETPPTGNWDPTHWMPIPDPPVVGSADQPLSEASATVPSAAQT